MVHHLCIPTSLAHHEMFHDISGFRDVKGAPATLFELTLGLVWGKVLANCIWRALQAKPAQLTSIRKDGNPNIPQEPCAIASGKGHLVC